MVGIVASLRANILINFFPPIKMKQENQSLEEALHDTEFICSVVWIKGDKSEGNRVSSNTIVLQNGLTLEVKNPLENQYQINTGPEIET